MPKSILESIIAKSKDTRKLFLKTSNPHGTNTCYQKNDTEFVKQILALDMVSVPIQYLFVISTTQKTASKPIPNSKKNDIDVDVHVKSFLSIDLDFVPQKDSVNNSILVKKE